MKRSISQRLYFGLAAGYIIVITVGVLAYLSYQNQLRRSQWVQHTHEVINTATTVKQLVSQLEVNKRNSFTVEKAQFSEAFDETAERLLAGISSLSVLVRDNTQAIEKVDVIERSANEVITYWRTVGDGRNTIDSSYLVSAIREGTQLTIELNQSIDRFTAYENELLIERNVVNKQSAQNSITTLLLGLILILLIVSILSYQVHHDIRARYKTQVMLKRNLKNMEALNAETFEQNWQLTSLSKINNLLQGQSHKDAAMLAEASAKQLAELLDIPSAVLYRFDEEHGLLIAVGKYAAPVGMPEFHELGVGITGQAAKSKEITVVNDLSAEQEILLPAGLHTVHPRSLVLVPLWVDDQLIGVMELLGLKTFSTLQLQLLELISHNMASTMQSVLFRDHLEELIEQISKQKEELETAQEVLTEQASALEQSNQYKSEFLANMSHELRTPLNSILILANLLSENKEGQLTKKQREYSQIIHKSGSDLLHLINDILDLSKIEAGKIELFQEEISVQDILTDMEDTFTYVAEERGIRLVIEANGNKSQIIKTDKKRTEQILKNLLSNGLKFTDRGGEVVLSIRIDEKLDEIYFIVKDSGRGIAVEYQSVIFEAFQQVDGATNRKFGGTGLGLSISKQLAVQLGGRLVLTSSVLGRGSEFTLTLPVAGTNNDLWQKVENQVLHPMPSPPNSAIVVSQDSVQDNRNEISDEKPTLLIIEDDVSFATILRDFAWGKGYQTIVALTGEEGLYNARKYKPSAILLDIHLPGLSGTEIIYKLKKTPELAKIPVHVITSHDDLGYLAKEITGITIKPFELGELDAIFENLNLHGKRVSLVPTDADEKLPQEIEASDSLTKPNAIVRSVDVVEPREANHTKTPDLTGCKVLLTDDDMRNLYALTAMLEAYGLDVVSASNGEEALELLATDIGVQVILMDIMMPIMDGYETITEIRKNNKWKVVPIIAISAKAMAGDRQKALDAGATEYLTKPVDKDVLISTIVSCLHS